MTIRQENVGSKKDFGLVGFSQEAPAQFLIFPRSLKPFEGQRVVGINYELFDPSPEPGAAFKGKEPVAKKKAKPAPPAVPAKPVVEAASRRRLLEAEPEQPKGHEPTLTEDVVPARSAKESSTEEKARTEDSTAKTKPAKDLDRSAVLKELKGAMKELEAGKAVLVFRRLEKLSERLAADE